MVYTNADQLINKRDDLCMFIADNHPDLILVTEVIPKAQVNPIAPALLDIPGFIIYTNFDPSSRNLGGSGIRGVAIYVHCSLHVSEVSFDQTNFKEQLWVEMALEGSDRLLIGCLYRSPSADGRHSTEALAELMKHVVSSGVGYSHVVIAGDFNMPDIDWGSGLSSAPATHCSHALIDAVQDCFLHQHITEPTRYRVGHEPHTLDLVMSNEEGMVQNIDFHPGLGHSDHIIITFDLECYTHHTEATGGAPNLHRANFDLLKHLIKSADWEMAVDKSVQKRYDH